VSFARDPGTLRYYDRRAGEYDEWYEGEGAFATRDRPGWDEEVAQVVAYLAGLPPARTLDVACGTAFLSRHLQGFVVGLDASPGMVAIAQQRLPDGLALVGDALALPFTDGAFDRVLAGHFYGHLAGQERTRFLAEARRVAPELVVVDSALRPGVEPEAWQARTLNDGSHHRVYKRHLSPADLRKELGAEVVHAGAWFVVAHMRQWVGCSK
jgi:ubiquinone/menaquinone biosynthesis C-methylase UbiE